MPHKSDPTILILPYGASETTAAPIGIYSEAEGRERGTLFRSGH